MCPLPVPFRLTPSQHLRSADTIEPIRSVHVVSHNLNGLLHTELCRSIAPCSQSWGPPGFRFSSSLSNRPAEASLRFLPALTEAIAFQRPHPQFLSTVRRPLPAPAQTRSHKRSSFPQAHPPFEAFPSHSAVPASPPCAVLPRHPIPPLGLTLTLLLSAPFFHVPPRPLPALASPGFQVTALNLKVLSRARVRCTNTSLPTYPCPLLPWAFQAPVHRCPSTVRSDPMSIAGLPSLVPHRWFPFAGVPIAGISDRNPAGRSNVSIPRLPEGCTKDFFIPTSSRNIDTCCRRDVNA